MRRYSSKNRKGFTLGEMLITVAVVAILSAVAIISVVGYLWNVRLLDADQAAREVYLAAQYHLSLARERGTLDQYKGKDLGTMDQLYADSDYVNQDGGTLYDLVYSPGNNAADVINAILPQGSIDETMRTGGSYIITYDKDTATVVGVFYSYAGRSYGYSFTADTLTKEANALQEAMNNKDSADAKAVRKHFPDTKAKKTIGFYGGRDLAAADKTDAPVLSIENGDTLSAVVTLSEKQNQLLTPTPNGYAIQLTIRGEKSGNTFTKVFDAKSADVVLPGKDNGIFQYAAVLDAWQDKDGGGSLQFGRQFDNLIPGENITVIASIVKQAGQDQYSSVSKPSNSVNTNSMFGSLKTENNQNTVTISSIRHLENLAKIDSSKLNIVKAQQVTDISFTAYQKNMASFFNNNHPDLYIYQPVELKNDLSYDAGYSDSKGNSRQYMLSDLAVSGVGVFDGLEEGKKLSVSNLQIIDINVKAEGGKPAGALLGNAKENTTVRADNILVWDKSAAIGITAEADAGGLIGHSDGTVTITNTAVSAYVKSTGGNAGGLAGSAAKLSVSSSYVSAHTYQGDYVTEVNPQTDKDGQHYNIISEKETAGGIVGTVSSLEQLTNSYVTASIYGQRANAFVGAVSDNDAYTKNKCYVVSVINGSKVKEPSTFSGNPDTKTKYVNDASLLENNEEVTYPFTVISTNDVNAKAWFLKTHVGDWTVSTDKEGKDIALVYYEKVAHKDADGNTVYNWYWHGYMQNLNTVSSSDWAKPADNPESVFKSTEISTDNEQSLDGNTIVDGMLDDPDTGGYYVVEDGYVLMLKNSNSIHAAANQINVYYGGNTDYNMADSGSIYKGFDEKLGYEDYTCYYLNTKNTVHWGDNNELTIVLDPWNDHTRRAQFFINPYFANNISDKAADFQYGGKYYHNGDIRSARQMNQLFTDGARFIANSDSGYNYVVSQTMDIDFSRSDFTALGEPITYENKTLSMNNQTDTSLSGIYQGVDTNEEYYHKLIGLTNPLFANVLYHTGEMRCIDIVNANTVSLVSNLNAGSIHDITIESSMFSGNAIARNGDNGTFENITVKDTVIAGNGIVDSGSGSQISNIQLVHCQIGKNGVVETNSSTVSNITISSHSTINGSGICSSNNGTISNVNIQDSDIKGSGISTAHNSSISDIKVNNCTIEGDGIVSKMTGGNIDTVSISQTSITGNGVATSSADWNSVVSNITMNDSTIGGDGFIHSVSSGVMHNITLSNVMISGNGFSTDLGGREVYACNIINAQIGKNGFAETFTGNTIVDCHIYADKDVYSKSTKTKFVLSGDSIGGAWNDQYNLYNLTVIGLKPNTKELTANMDSVSGFVNTIRPDQSSISGCSVTASIYGRGTVNGFADSVDSTGLVQVNDCYTNVIITSGYGMKKNETVSNGTVNGFARITGKNGSINYCVSSGMILCDPDVANQITASGFVNENTGSITDSISSLWYMQPSESYVFAKLKGKWLINCGYLYTEGVKNGKLTKGVTRYSAADLANLSDRVGAHASADTTKPYYTFVSTDGGQVVYPYRVPHQYKYENNNSTDTQNAQTWYGDWYQRGTTQSAMNSIYGLNISIDPAENDGKDSIGNNPSEGGGKENAGSNPATAKISDTFASNPNGMNLTSGTLLQDDQGKYVLIYGNNHWYNPCNGTAEDFVAKNPSNAKIIDSSTKISETPENGFTSALPAGTIAKDGDNYYVLNYDRPYHQGWQMKPSQDIGAWSVVTGKFPTF